MMINRIKDFLTKIKRHVTANKLAVGYFGVLLFIYLLGYLYSFDPLKAMMIVGFVLFTILATALWGYAGVVVFRALTLASIGVSIVFFLAQTYCGLPPELQTVDESAQALFGFGMAYAIVLFFISFVREIMGVKSEDKEKQKKGVLGYLTEINKGKFPFLPMAIYMLWVSWFLWNLVQVGAPIVDNLCIYK
jgi:hypothetical protein